MLFLEHLLMFRCRLLYCCQDYKTTLRQLQTVSKKTSPDTDTKKKVKMTGSPSDILREKAESQLDTYRKYMGEWESQMEKVKAVSL